MKWGKKKIDDVAIDVSDTVAAFKELLYQRTGVPVLRQKLMCRKCWKGKLLDSMAFSEMPKLKEGTFANCISAWVAHRKSPVARIAPMHFALGFGSHFYT